MEKKPKRCKNLISDKDMISSLPDNVIEMILSRLLLKDAIRTSFLSKDWRYKWRTMPDLIFHNLNSFSISKERRPSSSNKIFVRKVHQFLLLHKGDIRKFEFSGWLEISSVMDIWLDHLVGGRVQELVLDFSHKYLIPFSVLSSNKLITLNLTHCKIKLPSSFDGFKSLTSLVLVDITFTNDTALESLIQLCPLLKHLTLNIFDDCRLILHAPNLQSLTIDGSFSYLGFKETWMITTASFFSGDYLFCDLTNVLSSLTNVGDLQFLGHDQSPFTGVDYTLSMIQEIKFSRLKKLHLGVNLDCPKESGIVCCILKNSPALGYLNIIGHSGEGESSSTSDMFWKEPDNISFSFNNLKIFDMSQICGSKSEMRFIEFLFGNAPLLEVSHIELSYYLPYAVDKVDILIEMLSFKRVSCAKVFILKH